MGLGNGGKVAKASGGKKSTLKKENVERQLEQESNSGTESGTANKSVKNKLTGIVIDGKNWACAPCKLGHRVGSCNHAISRPMMPTHAPGRPAAGAPKKILCDCPRDCSCTKRDCKCARECSCVVRMWFLVKLQAMSEERWVVDRPVDTDLKGVMLSPEEAAERRAKKEAQHAEVSSPASNHSRRSSTTIEPTSPSQAKPSATGGCCTHKQVVAKEIRAGLMSHQHATNGANVSSVRHAQLASTHGCNCGAACACAFCPQHPNNQVSRNYVQQQAAFISQQGPIDTNFTHFQPSVPQEMSCMGGQPQFAVTRLPMQPDFSNFQAAFPSTNTGNYFLAYPMRHTDTPVPQSLSQIPMPAFPPTMYAGAANGLNGAAQSVNDAALNDNFDYGPFGSNYLEPGNAMVVNDGPNGWQDLTFQPDGHMGLPTLPANSGFDVLSPHSEDLSLSSNMGYSGHGALPMSSSVASPTMGAIPDLDGFSMPAPLMSPLHTTIPASLAMDGPMMYPMPTTSHSPEVGMLFQEQDQFDPNQWFEAEPAHTQPQFTSAL
ncbi:hypothetical protein LTR64_003841 [Lithohypha guttulata]|uniref:uncharacterized protein n=1 Tax=Lithohypha guttulata TaxID=1690604 RepID=UPI002DDED2D6|nr:hypothetical protein LTR51_006879 [Lithohypha guttulata]